MAVEHVQLTRGAGKGAELGVERVREVVPWRGNNGDEIRVHSRAGGGQAEHGL
jgi:hypothetical protein